MSQMNFIDYVKYSIFNMRTPDLIEKMRIKEIYDRIVKHKYNFVDFKTNGLSVDCGKFIYDMYKIIGPSIYAFKEEFVVRDGKDFSRYLIESTFTEEQKMLYQTFSKESMLEEIKKTQNSNAVFNEVKNNFIKFKDSMSGEKAREINLMFNLMKDFTSMFAFDFFLFLKSFCSTLIDGNYEANPQFKPCNNIQAVDDLIKLDYGVQALVLRKELFVALDKFQEYKGISKISEKNIKIFFSHVKYLQTHGLLSDIIIYLLKDFTYKCIPEKSNLNVVIGYLSDLTKYLKKDMEEIVGSLKSDRVASLVNKMFRGAEILKLANVNEERNEYLEKFNCQIFEAIEPIQYIKTFVIEIYERNYKEPLNELFLAAEFVDKSRSSKGLDAFYVVNDVRERINKFDSELAPETENSKRLRGWTASQSKANANRELIEILVKQFNDSGKIIVLDTYNSIIDLTTIIKGIIDDINKGTKFEILNPNKVQHLQNFTTQLAVSMQKDFDNFIALMKNFIR